MLRVQVELGEQRARISFGQRRLGAERHEARLVLAKRARACPISPNTTDGPMPTLPGAEGQATEQRIDQRRLAAPVRTGDREPLAPLDAEVERPEPECAALDDRILQRNDEVTRAPGRSEVEPQLPRLPRLLDPVSLEPLDAPRRSAGLRHQRVRATAARLLACDPGLLAPLAVQVAEARALLAPLRVRALVLGAGPLAGGLVLAPAPV
jgi:hypothetical protein